MRNEKGRCIAEYSADEDTQQRLLEQIDDRIARREFARAHRHPQHGKSEDGAHRVIERRFAHHRLRDAFLDLDLFEHRHQCCRIGGCEHGAEQQRDDEGHTKEIIGRRTGDSAGNQHADGGNHHDGDPHFF